MKDKKYIIKEVIVYFLPILLVISFIKKLIINKVIKSRDIFFKEKNGEFKMSL
jgi:lipopolysaccharide export LptBFGC system permease protein LptF